MVKRLKKPVEVRQFFIDDAGLNFVRIHSTDKTTVIFLKLASEKKVRKIGTVTKSTKTLKIKRKRAIHLFRKGNAYGFNDYVLRTAKTFDKIALSDDFSDWKIPVSYILENGKFLLFSQQGFELQRFVSLQDLEQFRILTVLSGKSRCL